MQSANNMEQMPTEPRTWAHDYLIPIAENVTGGLSVGAAFALGALALSYWDYKYDWYNVAGWSGIIGGAWAIGWNILRFFGDEVGIVTGAYRMGAASRDAEVANLELLLRESQDAANLAMAEGGASSAISKQLERDARTKRNAIKILEVAFAGDSISREAMSKRNMGQTDWEQSYRLLKASGVMDGRGVIVATTMQLALKAIDEKIKTDRQKGETFSPAWQ